MSSVVCWVLSEPWVGLYRNQCLGKLSKSWKTGHMLHSFLSPLRERLLSYISLLVLYCVPWSISVASNCFVLSGPARVTGVPATLWDRWDSSQSLGKPLWEVSMLDVWAGLLFSFPRKSQERESPPDCVMLCQGEVMCIRQCCSLNSPHPLLVTYMCLSGLSIWECCHQQIMLYAFYL